MSSLGTNLESEAYGLIVLINRMNRIPLMKNAVYMRMFLIQFGFNLTKMAEKPLNKGIIASEVSCFNLT